MSRCRPSYPSVRSQTWNRRNHPLLMVLGSGFALLLLPPGIHSQDAETQPYQIESWQVEDGLPQSSVTSIVQTREGYLWLGTFNGLVRFDGMRFKVFNPNT